MIDKRMCFQMISFLFLCDKYLNFYKESTNLNPNPRIYWSIFCIRFRLRSHRSRLFGYTVYVFEGTRILEINHYDFLIPVHIGGHYSKSSYKRVYVRVV